MIYIGKPIEFDEETFFEKLEKLERDAEAEKDVRADVKDIVPTYSY
jgi:hypothetical protein